MPQLAVVLRLAILLAFLAADAAAQQPDSAARRDSIAKARADSVAAARADSIAIARDLERLQGGVGRRGGTSDTLPVVQTGGGPTNARLLPDISAIGEVIGDFTPDSVTQESSRRFDIREVELAIAAAVDPYFRADVILGLNDLERISIEESYITTTALPRGLQAKIGRFHMPIGKQNTTHRAELQTIEYPHVIQRFLSPDAAKGTGLWLSQIFAPFGFYQELQLTAVDHFAGDEENALVTREPANRRLTGLGYSARLRNYVDITQSTNVEFSGSAATSRRAQPIACVLSGVPTDCVAFGNLTGTRNPSGVNARQSIVGADVTLRWKPLQQAIYKSFIFQAEVMRQMNERDVGVPAIPGTAVVYSGPGRDFTGAYALARYQIAQRRFVGARFDWLQDPEADGASSRAVSGYAQFFPSEFSKLVVTYERMLSPYADARHGRNRILLQSTFATGPHRPHPF